MLGDIDKTWISREFNIKAWSFPGLKAEDIFHYLVLSTEKIPDYLILHVGANGVIDYEASDIIVKTLQIKELIKLKVPDYKIFILRSIKIHDNDNPFLVIELIIVQFQQLSIDMIGNEYIQKKQFVERGLYLNDIGLKNFFDF